jgi:GNAT superfamily N-acetyltransferase
MIRHANEDDIPWLIGALKEWQKSFPRELVEYPGDEYCEKQFKWLMENEVVLVWEGCGFIAAMRGRHMANPNLTILGEFLWWVSPESRGKGVGTALRKKLTALARAMDDVDILSLTLEETSNVSDNTLYSEGFLPLERIFIMDVRTCR